MRGQKFGGLSGAAARTKFLSNNEYKNGEQVVQTTVKQAQRKTKSKTENVKKKYKGMHIGIQ